MPAKKKYYCEINVDKALYGRTSVKLQTDLLFWGEYFDFPDIPEINVITVNVFREIEKKKKRDNRTPLFNPFAAPWVLPLVKGHVSRR